MALDKSEDKSDFEMVCGFEDEISNLIETKPFFIDEWKIAYKSMEPKEIIHFLNHWADEISNLKNSSTLDELSKGIVSQSIFKQLIDKYPGPLISNNLKDKLLNKLNEKINPLEITYNKIGNLLKNKQNDEIINEINDLINLYEKFSGNKELIAVGINDFLYNILNNFDIKETEVDLLKFIMNTYLEFLKDKNYNINQAMLFIRLGSYFYDKNLHELAKKCLMKSKEIYNELGYEKDQAKIDSILKKFVKNPSKSKKTSKSKRKET